MSAIYICIPRVPGSPEAWRRSWIPWSCSHRWLWAMMRTELLGFCVLSMQLKMIIITFLPHPFVFPLHISFWESSHIAWLSWNSLSLLKWSWVYGAPCLCVPTAGSHACVTASHLTKPPVVFLDWLSSRCQGSYCVHTPSTEITRAHFSPWPSSMWVAGIRRLWSLQCAVSTSPMEPLTQPPTTFRDT